MAETISGKTPRTPKPRRQIAALPLRKGERGIEVCLITTRTTSRWTVPKGWRMKGRKGHDAARIEAEEEAGLKGRIEKKALGSFFYMKQFVDHSERVEVRVHPLHVTRSLPVWKEQGERVIQWMAVADAALVVDEPGLAELLTNRSAREGKRKAAAKPHRVAPVMA